jgi:hypothetical protein
MPAHDEPHRSRQGRRTKASKIADVSYSLRGTASMTNY